MSDPVISQRSPLVQKMAPGTYWWCACGKSATQPFCDGAHKGSEFSVQTVVEAEKTIAWCGCKHSKNKPFCDGSHAGL